MTNRTLIFLGLILVAFAGLLTWIALQPPPARPTATVAFIGYTNDATGTRLAAFRVSNASPSAVRRLSHYRIQIPISKRWTNISGGYISGGTSVLPPGGSETVTVVAPTNQASWRPWFVVSPGVGLVSDTMGAVADAAHAVGLRTRYRKTTYGADCDWIRE